MTKIDTLYGPVDTALLAIAATVRLLVCDVDGVLSDGRIYMGNQGEELKAFHTKDGFGLKAIRELGIEVAVITGRNSRIVSDRMTTLGIEHIYQGQGDKLPAFEDLLDKLGLDAQQAAYIGDDVIDIPVMRACALGVAVAERGLERSEGRYGLAVAFQLTFALLVGCLDRRLDLRDRHGIALGDEDAGGILGRAAVN